ncbi:MAG TPA: hypothetical protein VIM16_10990 [Mucilaginibacter sp.]|jgi:hypothetical protein
MLPGLIKIKAACHGGRTPQDNAGKRHNEAFNKLIDSLPLALANGQKGDSSKALAKLLFRLKPDYSDYLFRPLKRTAMNLET